jgi:hypothetical protein
MDGTQKCLLYQGQLVYLGKRCRDHYCSSGGTRGACAAGTSAGQLDVQYVAQQPQHQVQLTTWCPGRNHQRQLYSTWWLSLF